MIEEIPYITDIGITIAGSVDSGKSTFVGVLNTNILDNGNGSARLAVAKHPHEVNSGKTSDISLKHFIVKETNRAITMIDLCGHDKYFKTTAYGVSGCFPDYSFVVVGANRGILPMTKQHFTLLLSMNIPIIILITRIDITPKETYDMTVKQIEKYCKDVIRIPAEIINNYFSEDNTKNDNDNNYNQEKLNRIINSFDLSSTMKQPFVPVISISNKTGYYVDFVKQFMSKLPPRNIWGLPENNRIINSFMTHMDQKFFIQKSITKPISTFYVDSIYTPPGIGIVVTGINRGEDLNVGDTIYIGPINKEFKEIKIRSIHNDCKQKVFTLKHHHRGTIAITGDKDYMTRQYIKRGMIIIRNKELAKTNLCFRFKAGITIFNHSSTLKTNYTPLLQIGNIRQSAKMYIDPNDNSGKDVICVKEYAYVTFKFESRPEFIEPYQVFIFRSGNVHGVGVILDIVPIINDPDARPETKKSHRRSNIKIFKK
jgi:elongation factor 1-alpha